MTNAADIALSLSFRGDESYTLATEFDTCSDSLHLRCLEEHRKSIDPDGTSNMMAIGSGLPRCLAHPQRYTLPPDLCKLMTARR